MFNNREIASAIWLLLFAGWILTKSDIRNSIAHLFRAFLRWKIVACFLAMSVYVVAVVCVFWSIGLWVPLMTKDAILWVSLTGLVMLMQFMTARDSKNVFQSIIRENVKLLLFIEFFIGTYCFSLVAEMVFVPLLVLLVMLDTVAGTSDEYTDVKKLTGFLVSIFGLGILFYAINRAFNDWSNLGTVDTLRSIAFAPLMSIAFIPFIHGSMLVAAYESLFVRLDAGHAKPSEVKRYAKIRILKHCGFSLKKLRDLSSKSFQFHTVETKDQVDGVFKSNPEIAC
ncbi:hypothetical protein N9Y42_01715 [Mariniblastus sp.]|nr:hypothetical protein [Mariniblastus sp.]